MIDFESIPSFEDTIVIYSDTIYKSSDEYDNQTRFQNNPLNSRFYEQLAFYESPILFHSFVILNKGEFVSLKSDHVNIDIESETSLKSDSSDLKVFIRVVDDQGLLKYNQLCLLHNKDESLVFVHTHSLEKKELIFVDRILIAGSFNTLSYLILAHNKDVKRFSTWNLFNTTVYYGDDVLDLNKHTLASDSLCESISIDGYKSESSSNKPLKEIKSGNYKTMYDLTRYLTVNEHYEKVQNLKKSLSYLVDADKSDVKLEESISMLTKFIPNDLLFTDFLDYNVLRALTIHIYTNFEYEEEDNHFKLLKMLLHDERIAKHLLFDLEFYTNLPLIFSQELTHDQRKCLLNILLILLSHPNCLSIFMTNKNEQSMFFYNNFVYQLSSSETIGLVFSDWFEQIGENVSVFVAVCQTTNIYNKLNRDRIESGKTLYENLNLISLSVNDAIDAIMAYGQKKRDSLFNNNLFTVNFLVSCFKELQFVDTLYFLFESIYLQLSSFPALIFDVKSFVEKPFNFVNRFIEYLPLQDCITTLYKISTLVTKLYTPLNTSLRTGFPYCQEVVSDYFNAVSKQCIYLLTYCKLLSLLSYTISQGSFDSSIDQIDSISKNCVGFYDIFNRILHKTEISNFILNSLNAYAILLRDDRPSPLTNKINKNVSILVNIICKTIYEEKSFDLSSDFGRGFTEFIEFYHSKLSSRSEYLDYRLVETCLTIFNNVINLTSFHLESSKKQSIEDLRDFLEKSLKQLGLNFNKIFIGYQSDSHSHKYKHHKHTQSDSKNTVKRPKLGESDHVSGSFSNSLNIKKVDCYSANTTSVEEAVRLGVQVDTFKYYEAFGLSVVPPETIPPEIDYILSFVKNLALNRENQELFTTFIQKRNSKPLLALWLYLLCSLRPDLDTLVNAEVNAFSSLVGYSWLRNIKSYISTISKIMNIYYWSLRHLSKDTVDDSSEFNLENKYNLYEEEFDDNYIFYTNDELLNCLIISSTHVSKFVNNEGYVGFYYTEVLSRLMNYWFRRFKRSRVYILNYLMSTASLVPRMYEGVTFLIISCKPFYELRTELQFLPMETNNGSEAMELDQNPEDNTENLLDNDDAIMKCPCFGKTFSIADKTYKVDHKLDDKGKAEFIEAIINKFSGNDKKLLVEFILTVCRNSQSVDPSILVSSSYLYYFLFINDFQLLEFMKLAIKDTVDLESTLRLIVFYSNIMRLYSIDICKRVETIFAINNEHMNLIVSLIDRKGFPQYAYTILFEAIYYSFSAHNRTWLLDPQRLIIHKLFGNYVNNMLLCLRWLFKTLNTRQMNFTGTEVDNQLDSDSLLLALNAVLSTFRVPCNALIILYSLSDSEKFIPYLVRLVKSVKRGIRKSDKHQTMKQMEINFSTDPNVMDSELSVKPCEFLLLNDLSEHLVQHALNPQNLSPSAIFNLINCFEVINNIYSSILHSAKNQDIFVVHMATNQPYERLKGNQTITDVFKSTLITLNILLYHVKSQDNLKHMAALLASVRANYDEMNNLISQRQQFGYPDKIKLSSIFRESVVENRFFYFTPCTKTFTKSFLPTLKSYSDWKYWEKLVSLSSFEIDYKKDSFLPFTRNATFEHALEDEKFDSDIANVKVECSAEKPPKSKSVLTTDQWKDFDQQLSENGIDLIAFINNPSILLEPKSRKTFLNVLLRNEAFFTHLIKLGLDVSS